MLIVPFNIFIGLGIGAMLVVIASVASALTLLPAILSLAGDNINRLKIPWVGGSDSDPEQVHGFWDSVSSKVMKWPIVSLVLAGGLLIIATVPAFDMHTGFTGVSTLPEAVAAKEGFVILVREFSAGNVTPAQIVIQGDIDSLQPAIQDLTKALKDDPPGAFGDPMPLEVSDDGTVALFSVPVIGDSAEDVAVDAIKRLREVYVPRAFDSISGVSVAVTGETAYNIDFFDSAANAAKFVFPFVLGMSFIFLLVVFRSMVVPVVAIVLNLLSVGATYGILVLAFQKGWGENLGVLSQFDIIEAWIPRFPP